MYNILKTKNIKSNIYCLSNWLNSDNKDLIKNGYPKYYYQFLADIIYSKNTDVINPLVDNELFYENMIENNILFDYNIYQ